MHDKQKKDDLKPQITTPEKTKESKPPVVQGNETDKPMTGAPAKREAGQREAQPTRDDGDNDDKGELS